MNRMTRCFCIFSVLVVIVLCAAAEETVPQENALQGDEIVPSVMDEDQTDLSEVTTFLEQQEHSESEVVLSVEAQREEEVPPPASVSVSIEEPGPLGEESTAQQPDKTPAEPETELQVSAMDTGETSETLVQNTAKETKSSSDGKSIDETDETCSIRQSETDDFLSEATCSADHAADEPLIPPAVDAAGADTSEPGAPEMSAPETEEIPQIVQGEIEINSNEVPAEQETASPREFIFFPVCFMPSPYPE